MSLLSMRSVQPRICVEDRGSVKVQESKEDFNLLLGKPDLLIYDCDIAYSNLLMGKGCLTQRLDICALRNCSCQFVFQKNCHVTQPFKDMYFLGNKVHMLHKIDVK